MNATLNRNVFHENFGGKGQDLVGSGFDAIERLTRISIPP
jgi:hypothetical protein